MTFFCYAINGAKEVLNLPGCSLFLVGLLAGLL